MLDRSKTPEPNGKISFQLPAIKKFYLSNKLSVSFIQKNNLPIVQIGIIISAGSKYDFNGKKGTANLTAMLIDEGAGELNALQIDKEFEMLGTVFSIAADHDSVIMSMLCLKENLVRSLEILSKILISPGFEEDNFLREQRKCISKIIQMKDDPSYIASTVFDNLISKNTPYAYPTFGYEQSVTSITNEDVKDFYNSYYTVDNSHVVVAGNISLLEIKDLLETHFSGWRKYSQSSYGVLPARNDRNRFYFVHKEQAQQSEIRIGHISKGRNASDYFDTMIMNTILGGQFTSRINLNLREKHGFTYGAGSSFNYNKEYGYFEVDTAVHSQNTAEAITEILKELDGIREYVKEEEFNFAKSYLIKRYPSMFETYSQLTKNMALLYMHNLPDDYFDMYLSIIESVSLADVKNAAINNILTDQLTVLIVGDKNIILPQLNAITDEPMQELDISGNVVV